MRNSSHTVMLVDPDEATLTLYERVLSREYRVVACSDEREALAMLHSHDIHAIVLEPGHSDGRGWNLLEDIQRSSSPTYIPVILCSTLDERKRGLELGAVAYLIKPVLPTALLESVRQVVGQPR